ncbi:MAG: SMC-Scp complex subunit ScpB [Elusimicrobia bacterium]|nr:SMC-Scp complex subunit ScpB [Elusimicrobiota bacterium]
MEINELKKVIEALLFVSDKPLLTREIKAVIKEDLSENDKLEDILKQMQEEYNQLNLAFELKFVADGWTFATKPQYSSWIKKLLKEKTILKLSPSAMEVLAIIAYKQPITRAEIDNIRGVDCGGVLDTLTDRKFVKIVGRKESLGRPLLYGTTQEFLRHFGLSHLSELPIIENAEAVTGSSEKVQELPFENNEENGAVLQQQENIQDNVNKNVEENAVDNKQENIPDGTVSENDNNVEGQQTSPDENTEKTNDLDFDNSTSSENKSVDNNENTVQNSNEEIVGENLQNEDK